MSEEEKQFHLKETMQNIAHQWRQPLSQINSTVAVIDRHLYEKNIQDSFLEEKLQEIEELTKYMSSIIETFQNSSTKNELTRRVSLTDITEEAISLVQASFKQNKINISTNIGVEYKCECHKERLKEIIIVLLNNAKDALLERNTFEAYVKVSIVYEDDTYKIKIFDNAGGITKSVKEKIFEPYYTTKHSSQGTGIGLYMAKKIIEDEHAGSLDVKNLDTGTEFSISLPVK